MIIRLLKFIDKIVGRVLVFVLPPPAKGKQDSADRVLFIRPGGIGDAVLLIPVINQFKSVYPDARIDVLAEKRNATIFRMSPAVERIFLYDTGRDLWDVLRSTYDVVIDTEQWHRLTAVVAWWITSRIKVGYGTNERRKLYTDVVDYSHEQYEYESFGQLLKPLGVEYPPDLPVPFLAIPHDESDIVRSTLESLESHAYVVLFPGASIPERRWGAERFHRLACMLNTSGYPIVVIGGAEDRPAGEKIISGVEGINLAGQTTLLGSAAIIGDATLLVSGDSGMLHVGVGLGQRTVSLFGSGIAAKWAPRSERHVVIDKGLPCSPCTRFGYTPPCPIAVKCLAEISVDEVYAAAIRLIGSREQARDIQRIC